MDHSGQNERFVGVKDADVTEGKSRGTPAGPGVNPLVPGPCSIADVPRQMERRTDMPLEPRNNNIPMLNDFCHKVNCVGVGALASSLFLCGPHKELSSRM